MGHPHTNQIKVPAKFLGDHSPVDLGYHNGGLDAGYVAKQLPHNPYLDRLNADFKGIADYTITHANSDYFLTLIESNPKLYQVIIDKIRIMQAKRSDLLINHILANQQVIMRALQKQRRRSSGHHDRDRD